MQVTRRQSSRLAFLVCSSHDKKDNVMNTTKPQQRTALELKRVDDKNTTQDLRLAVLEGRTQQLVESGQQLEAIIRHLSVLALRHNRILYPAALTPLSGAPSEKGSV